MNNALNDILEHTHQLRHDNDDNSENNNSANNDDNNDNNNINDNNSENNDSEDDFNINNSFGEEDDDDESEYNHGISLEDLFLLPRSKIPDVSKLEEKQCTICLTEYNNGDELTTLPCFHFFHPKCINIWLQRSNNCPICKNEVKLSNDNN